LSHALSLFALVISETGSQVYARAGLDCYPIYASHVAGMTGVYHLTQLFFNWLTWQSH
jgi:hypothetical protein